VRPDGSTFVSNHPDFAGINHEVSNQRTPDYRADSSSSVAVAYPGSRISVHYYNDQSEVERFFRAGVG
jgi:selenocysteine lyase/cysteine desulfurase